jgi:hypothetical protein
MLAASKPCAMKTCRAPSMICRRLLLLSSSAATGAARSICALIP